MTNDDQENGSFPARYETRTMRQLQVLRPFEVVVGRIPEIEPAEGEVQVEIAFCGICGSDIHAYQGLHPFIPIPAYPGHEGAGIVSRLGKGAGTYGLKVGDKVIFEPNLNCGVCYNCRTGRYNICEHLKVMGCQCTERTKGMMADKFVAPAGKVIKIPPEMSLKKAAMTEPLAVGLHAVRRSGLKFGDRVVIFGAGAIGLSVLQFARLAGAKVLLIADYLENRLEVAKRLGATHVVNPANGESVSGYLDKRPEIMGFEGVDEVFECVGVEESLNESVRVCRKGGAIIVLGVFGKPVNNFNAAWVQDREFNIIGSLMYTRRDITDALDAIYRDDVDVEPMITGLMDLDDGARAFKLAHKQAREHVKVMIRVAGE